MKNFEESWKKWLEEWGMTRPPHYVYSAFLDGYKAGFLESQNSKPPAPVLIPTSMNTIGLDTGIKDRNGNPVHLGDVLEFDEREWGGKHIFTIEFEEGELNTIPSDVSEWCTIVKKWNE